MIARDAMTPVPLTVTPRTSVAAALRLARDNRISRLPVVERGRILGVVRALAPAIPLAEAARRLLQQPADEALVVEDDRLVGILTHSDLLRALLLKPEAVA